MDVGVYKSMYYHPRWFSDTHQTRTNRQGRSDLQVIQVQVNDQISIKRESKQISLRK
jgi:hypothetical protein